jgi:hypothetical protein
LVSTHVAYVVVPVVEGVLSATVVGIEMSTIVGLGS